MDGRGCEDYRHMEIETDVVSNTDGSAKVTLVSISEITSIQLKQAFQNISFHHSHMCSLVLMWNNKYIFVILDKVYKASFVLSRGILWF